VQGFSWRRASDPGDVRPIDGAQTSSRVAAAASWGVVMRTIALWVAATLALSVGAARAADIHLICDGAATFPDTQTASLWGSDNHGGFGSASGYATTRGQSEGEAMVDITGSAGRVKLPSAMIPALHDDMPEGWRPFDTIAVGETEITGRFTLNFLDKPTVRINRVSGHIEIKGVNKRTFNGECRAYDAGTERRF